MSTTAGQAPERVLEVEHLRTEFHVRAGTVAAVDDVSLGIDAGECVGLVGESGCGKSTTGLSIMRLLPRSGHIAGGRMLLDGRDLVPLSEPEMRRVRGREVSMIFQDPMTSLNPTMTIGAQVAEPLVIHLGASKRAARARALEVLGLVGVPNPRERIDDYPHHLSGGLRQRVMIATALAAEPKLLIADEPTTALDVTIQAQILDLLDRLRQELSMAVLLITHDMGVIAGRADRVMVMYAGRMVEAATTGQLFGDTSHPYASALLESIPQLDRDASSVLPSIPGHPPDLSQLPPGCRFAPRCRFADQRCSAEDPPLEQRSDGHAFACFHPVGSAAHHPGAAPDQAWSPPPAGAISASATGTADGSDTSGSDAGGGTDSPETPAAVSAPAPGAGPGPARVASDTGAGGSLPSRAERDAELSGAPLLVEIDHLVKEYPVRAGGLRRSKLSVKAVSDVSFAIREGETFGLVGESGCGKSTLGRMVAALEAATSGSVRLAGEELLRLHGAALRRRRRDLQLMFQDPYASLDPRMRVGSILREPLVVQGVGDRREQWETVARLLDDVGLGRRSVELYPHEFSGGQRQRIGMARALALNPRLVVADEPVSALDVSIQSQILNLMKALQRSYGLTYLVISHDLAVLRYLSDTIGVMYLGKLVELGPAQAVYTKPVHPYTHGLLQAIPVPDPVAERAKRTVAVRGELPSAVTPPSGCRFRTRCPLAQDICAEQEPPLRVFGASHVAACHLPLQPPTTDTPPPGVVTAIPAGDQPASAAEQPAPAAR